MNVVSYLNMVNSQIESVPSPAEGIFISEVKIGDQIKKRQLLGRVIESFTGKSMDVYADMDGLVFLYIEMVKVKPGDALGGLMLVGPINNKVVYE